MTCLSKTVATNALGILGGQKGIPIGPAQMQDGHIELGVVGAIAAAVVQECSGLEARIAFQLKLLQGGKNVLRETIINLGLNEAKLKQLADLAAITPQDRRYNLAAGSLQAMTTGTAMS